MRMTTDGARFAIVAFSLLLTGILLVFLMLAPDLHMPFTPGAQENLHLLQVVLPVFLGYLGSAAHFLFRAHRDESALTEADQRLLFLLVNGPFLIFVLFNTVLFFIFYSRNQPSGTGFSFDDLSQWFSIGLGVLTCVVSVVSSYVFGVAVKTAAEQNQSPANAPVGRP